ncbi:MAG: hypothetical protein U9Q15_02815 [Patescibacteria group bacterium]|nr:hypothetical protein [Patescibacteria group bacterium]
MQGIADWFNDSVDGVNSKQDTITIVGGADAAGVIAGETISGGVTPTYKMTSYTGKRMNQMFDSWDLLGEFVISGFPSAITKWVDRQIARFKKSLMPPAIKLRYPVWQQGNALAAVIEDTSTDWADVLNYIANLPVVNIKTERIQVDLPAVSSQDLALMKKNMIDWINDIGSQMESKWCMNIPKHASGTDEYRQGYRYDFMAYGSDVETVTNEEGEEVFDAASLATLFVDEGCTLVDNSKFKTSLVVDASELGSSVKRNLEIIDVYLALPQTIYQYKYALEIYAKQIMDQIRQLVQITGGWFVMNMKVIQQWFTFIKMIQTIIQGWEALISIINGIVQSCSTCKSYRLDLTTWIMELIGGMIPTPPDINFPRWPDVVVDVSGVTLEMDIRWPSLDIRPVPFDFPVLPRLNLPEIPPFKIDYNYQLALPSVPILPPPPDLPPLPSLQVLPDWELPYLDAPPKLPAAPGSIKSFLSVVETVMNIACFIYTNNIVFPATTTGKGTQDVPIWMTAIKPNFAAGIAASFVPVPFPVFDMWIAQCEVLTERPMSPVLPIDFSFNWNIGDIDLTIVDEIVAYATVDAVIDLDPTYTFYESADRVNEMTKNFNEDLQGTLDAIQEDLDEEAGKMNERFAAEQDRWEESKDNFEEYMAHNVGLRHFQEKINAQQEKFDEIDANSKALTAEMLEDMEALSDQMEECMKSYENDANGDPVGDSAACKSGYGEDDEDEETAMFLYPQLQCSPTSLYAGHVKQAAAKQRYLAQLVAPHTEESQKYYASLETGLHSIQQKQEARDNNFEDTIRQYFSVLAGRDISFGELRNTFE